MKQENKAELLIVQCVHASQLEWLRNTGTAFSREKLWNLMYIIL